MNKNNNKKQGSSSLLNSPSKHEGKREAQGTKAAWRVPSPFPRAWYGRAFSLQYCLWACNLILKNHIVFQTFVCMWSINRLWVISTKVAVKLLKSAIARSPLYIL